MLRGVLVFSLQGLIMKPKLLPDILKYRLICCTVLPAFLRLIIDTVNIFGDLTIPVFLLPYFLGSPEHYDI